MSKKRKADLKRAALEFRKTLDKPFPTLQEIARGAVMKPGVPFYMSYDYARRVYSEFTRGKSSLPGRPMARMMLEEFIEQVEQYRARHPRATPSQAVQEVLAQGRASRFYISPSQAQVLLSA